MEIAIHVLSAIIIGTGIMLGLITAYCLIQRLLQRVDEKRIEEAEKAHDTYRDLCLKSDRMIIPTKN